MINSRGYLSSSSCEYQNAVRFIINIQSQQRSSNSGGSNQLPVSASTPAADRKASPVKPQDSQLTPVNQAKPSAPATPSASQPSHPTSAKPLYVLFGNNVSFLCCVYIYASPNLLSCKFTHALNCIRTFLFDMFNF